MFTCNGESLQILELNQAARDKFVIDRENIKNLELADLLSGNLTDQLSQFFNNRVSGDKNKLPSTTALFETKEGNTFYGEITAQSITQSESTDKQLLINIRDLGVIHNPGELTGSDAALLEELMHRFPDAIYFKDRQCRFLRINQKQAEVLGVDQPEQAVGKTDFDYFPEAHSKMAYRDEQHVMNNNQPLIAKEELVTNAKGEQYWVTATKVPLRNEDDRIIGIMGISRDINQRKRMEENLRREKYFSDSIIKSLPGVFYVINHNLEYERWNENLETTLGYSTEEVAHLNPLDRFREEDRELIKQKIKQAQVEGVSQVEADVYTRDGSIIPFLLTGARFENDGEKYIVGTGIDISEKLNYERELRKSIEEKKVLLEEIHHRVKNNLAIIIGLLELQSYNTEDSETVELLRDSQSRIYSMALVHEQLYKFESFSEIDVKKYIGKLIDTIRNTFSSEVRHIDVHIDSDSVCLPLTQAIPCGLLLNEVITNTFKHAFPDKKEGEVGITIQEDHDEVLLKVHDNGIGYPDDISSSSSMGMTLIETLASQLEGSFEFYNNEGAIFEIRFQIQ